MLATYHTVTATVSKLFVHDYFLKGQPFSRATNSFVPPFDYFFKGQLLSRAVGHLLSVDYLYPFSKNNSLTSEGEPYSSKPLFRYQGHKNTSLFVCQSVCSLRESLYVELIQFVNKK